MPRYAFLVVADGGAEQANMDDVPMSMFEDMTTFNEKMAEAGVLLDADGFRPTSVDSFRLKFGSSSGPEVISGPFDFDKEDHICGYWLVKCKDADEALGWAKQVPFPQGELLVRRIAETSDMGKAFSKELTERESKLKVKLAANRKAAEES